MLFNPNMEFKNVDFPELILPITGIANLFIFIYLKYFESNSGANCCMIPFLY